MEILKFVPLFGANRWSPVSAIEALVDFGSWRDLRTERHAPFRDRMREWLAAMGGQLQPTSLAKATDDNVSALRRALNESLQIGTTIPNVAQQLVRLLQTAIGISASFGEAHETEEDDVFLLAFQYEEVSLGRACLESARQIMLAARDGQPFDLAAEVRKLVDQADDDRLGPSTRAMVRAAAVRNIPFRRLNDGSLVQYGEGKYARRTWTAETDATGAIGESIARDKALTKRFLAAAGVPVPRGRSVKDAQDAWTAALEIGFPVVVKPRDANHARGISLDLTTREQVVAAYEWARKDGDTDDVMVEQFARGQAHRLLVIGDRLVAAARGESEFVVGDGAKTIRELVDDVNKDPRRGENYTDLLNVLKLDDAALIELKKQKLTPDSVPPAGKRVLVQHVGDLTTDCTADVHPKVAARAVLAARVVGLDIAGLDVVAEDIRVPLEEQRGMILEVNAGPSLSMHIAPLHGRPQPVGEAIVDMMFAPDARSRVPIVMVCGSGDRTLAAKQIENLLRRANRHVGLATAEGIAFNGEGYTIGSRNDRDNLLALLSHPGVDTVVFESRPEKCLVSGLGYERCDVVVVPELASDTTDSAASRDCESDSPTHLAVLAALRALPRDGTAILPAKTHDLERLLRVCQGSVILFDPRENSPRLEHHRRQGGQVAFFRDGKVVLATQTVSTEIGAAKPASELQTLLPVFAAVWAVGSTPSSSSAPRPC